MTGRSDNHNDLATEFVLSVLGPTIKAGGGASDIMVLMESMMLGCLLLNERVFGTSRSASAEMLDAAANAVAERLTAVSHGGRR